MLISLQVHHKEYDDEEPKRHSYLRMATLLTHPNTCIYMDS